ncbi:hypothetical protein TNCV_887491 [Trichonephila clavipes]|uniref:Uncharacterized protein n=1 Tax=Trichonephila clavipes TaxID=2585209 RepID=A0A8X6RE55_TRICX|nr:hypothetical protein TNCV_887491 [Trichonephila clavipes]
MEEVGGLGIPLRSLWPTLHCRRVAGVSPLLSILFWCPRRYTAIGLVLRIRDVRFNRWILAPMLYHYILGVLQVSAMPGFCQMTGTLPPLLDSVVGGGPPE